MLHSFTGGMDGAGPRTGLVAGTNGVLYGTTAYGGNLGCSKAGDSHRGCGTVFEIVP